MINRSIFVPGLVIASVILGLTAIVSYALANESGDVTILTVEREVTAGTVSLIDRGLRTAERSGSSHFILELHTPGGLLKATEEISRLLIDSTVTTVVYIHKESGWALSAGTYILFSADIAASTPTATIGAALPVSGGEAAPDKVVEASSAWLLSLVERRGGSVDSDLVRSLVTEAKTVSGKEAAEIGLLDYVSDTRSELLSFLGLGEAEVTIVQPTFIDETLGFLSLPYLVPLLLSLGALGIFFMFRTGEVEVFGLLGVVFLFLGLWGMGAIQLSLLGTLLLGFGIILIAVELLFSPGFGVAGAVGILCLILGILTFANEPLYPSYFRSVVFYSVLGVCTGLGLIMALLGRLSYTALRQPIAIGKEALLNQSVLVTETIAPVGAVRVGSERYVAESASGRSYEAGTTVKVAGLRGNTILVE